MDFINLKKYAELLETSIQSNLNRNKDVEYLAQYPLLIQAINDAKVGEIKAPRSLGGLGRWILDESSIPGIADLSDKLTAFSLLLRGFDLPSDSD